jgi:hypothetical protein
MSSQRSTGRGYSHFSDRLNCSSTKIVKEDNDKDQIIKVYPDFLNLLSVVLLNRLSHNYWYLLDHPSKEGQPNRGGPQSSDNSCFCQERSRWLLQVKCSKNKNPSTTRTKYAALLGMAVAKESLKPRYNCQQLQPHVSHNHSFVMAKGRRICQFLFLGGQKCTDPVHKFSRAFLLCYESVNFWLPRKKKKHSSTFINAVLIGPSWVFF